MIKPKSILPLIVSVGLMAATSAAHATAIANSNVSFDNFQATAASGTLEFLVDWEVTVFSEARNSLGELDQDFAASFLGGSVATTAAVTWASGQGSTSAPDSFPPDFSISGMASSDVNIPGGDNKSASSLGRGSLISGFRVTGGTGTVDVDFSADLNGVLQVLTDSYGLLAATEVIFTMEIFDALPVTGTSPQDQLVFSVSRMLSIGQNAQQTLAVAESLSTTRTFEYDTPYFFIIEVDAESRGVVAAPATIVLVAIGLLGIPRQRRLLRLKFPHEGP